MAVAAYDSDLTSANSGEIAVGDTATDAGSWGESTDATWRNAGTPGDEVNFYINYANCISAQFTTKGTNTGVILYVDTGTFAVDTNGAVLIWSFWASPSSLNTFGDATRAGVQFVYGTTVDDFEAVDCGGSDFEPNPLGGWYCYALDPAAVTADDTLGTPGTAPFDTWGISVTAAAQARGYPFAVNAIRGGRCTLEVTNGQAGDYGTFSGMESFDTSTNVRYGLFQNIYGSYRWQGLMSLGVTATAVDFRDGNVNISVANTPNVTSSFNKIEVHHASSNVEWSAVNISAPGVNDTVAATASRGDFEAVDNGTIAKTSCSFTDMGTFIYQSNSTMDTVTYRRCNLVTQAGATFTSCVFEETNDSEKALLVTNPTVVTYSNFVSDGTKHAVRCDTIGTYSWIGNTDTGYTGTRGSNLLSSTGSTNAMFYNNSGGLITLNVSGGGQQPTVRNGAGATTQVNANILVTYTGLINGSEIRIYNTGTSTEIDGIESVTGNQFSWSVGSGTGMDIVILGPTPTPPSPPAIAYIPIREENISFTTATSVQKNQQINRNYYDV